jgi:hypothetical protein
MKKRGWPGMLGSVDCMHWMWKNARNACQFCGKSHYPTIILEAITSHYFVGLALFYWIVRITQSDINILHRSTIFSRLASRDALACNYNKVNRHDYTMNYYLIDGIYLSWATFVKTILAQKTKK